MRMGPGVWIQADWRNIPLIVGAMTKLLNVQRADNWTKTVLRRAMAKIWYRTLTDKQFGLRATAKRAFLTFAFTNRTGENQHESGSLMSLLLRMG